MLCSEPVNDNKTSESTETIPFKKVKRPPIQKIIIIEKLNILDAAERVLIETKKTMTTRKIVIVAKEKQYWGFDAATLWTTLHTALIERHSIHGSQKENAVDFTGRRIHKNPQYNPVDSLPRQRCGLESHRRRYGLLVLISPLANRFSIG